MDDNGPTIECEECGGTEFHKEAGHFYCNECQTQSQQIQEHVFEQEEAVINKKATKKIRRDKSKKVEEKLTSWECYNLILKGLTEELIALGAKPDLKIVVRCLWMKYLHKCEVFDVKSDRLPKVSILGSQKDIGILYNVKKRKRSRSRCSSVSTTLSSKRQANKTKRALVNSQYEDLSVTMDTSMGEKTLSSLKSGSEKSDQSNSIGYNRFSNAELKRIMSKKHRKAHKHDVAREMTCHKFATKNFRPKFAKGPTVLTPVVLYILLYIGLNIIEDDIQLGDLIRFIREGHITFGSYRHFFDDDIPDKLLNLPKRNTKLFVSDVFRKRAGKMAQFLDVVQYIKKPDMAQLCQRFCTEMALPTTVSECAQKIVLKSDPQMAFKKNSKAMPNYEARVMSCILFVLKLLFSLDGVTENLFSDYANVINSLKIGTKMFDFRLWVKFIAYRDAVMKKYHVPSAIKHLNNFQGDAYLSYFRSQEINLNSSCKHMHSELKDFLQVLEKLCDDNETINSYKFPPSLTPTLNSLKVILNQHPVPCEDLLENDFTIDSINFLLKPNVYLGLLETLTVKNGGANDKIAKKQMFHLYETKRPSTDRNKNLVTVKIDDTNAKHKESPIREFLKDKKSLLESTDASVFLSNWQEGKQKQFDKNRIMLRVASELDNIQLDKRIEKLPIQGDCYKEHFNPFERYWLNITANPAVSYFSKSDMSKISQNLSVYFKIILQECARIIEQDQGDFYAEFLMTELYLVYFVNFSSERKKDIRECKELKKVLKNCRQYW